MSFLNVEIKARCRNPEFVRNYLQNKNAQFKGVDWQKDTYYLVEQGRLKLREGNIENNLIYYERPDQEGPKHSAFKLVPVQDAATLSQILEEAVGIKVIVEKNREIYFIDNVKFHIDKLEALGDFVEIEAGNLKADLSVEKLQEQCDFYMQELGIQNDDLIAESYSDMLLKLSPQPSAEDDCS